MKPVDYENIARNLSRINATAGTFGFSDRDGGASYQLLEDGRYEFRDLHEHKVVATVFPKEEPTPVRVAQPFYRTEIVLAQTLLRMEQAESLLYIAKGLLSSEVAWETWRTSVDMWMEQYKAFVDGGAE